MVFQQSAWQDIQLLKLHHFILKHLQCTGIDHLLKQFFVVTLHHNLLGHTMHPDIGLKELNIEALLKKKRVYPGDCIYSVNINLELISVLYSMDNLGLFWDEYKKSRSPTCTPGLEHFAHTLGTRERKHDALLERHHNYFLGAIIPCKEERNMVQPR